MQTCADLCSSQNILIYNLLLEPKLCFKKKNLEVVDSSHLQYRFYMVDAKLKYLLVLHWAVWHDKCAHWGRCLVFLQRASHSYSFTEFKSGCPFVQISVQWWKEHHRFLNTHRGRTFQWIVSLTGPWKQHDSWGACGPNNEKYAEFYANWVKLQEDYLHELLVALDNSIWEAELLGLVQKVLTHYEEYYTAKDGATQQDV